MRRDPAQGWDLVTRRGPRKGAPNEWLCSGRLAAVWADLTACSEYWFREGHNTAEQFLASCIFPFRSPYVQNSHHAQLFMPADPHIEKNRISSNPEHEHCTLLTVLAPCGSTSASCAQLFMPAVPNIQKQTNINPLRNQTMYPPHSTPPSLKVKITR